MPNIKNNDPNASIVCNKELEKSFLLCHLIYFYIAFHLCVSALMEM